MWIWAFDYLPDYLVAATFIIHRDDIRKTAQIALYFQYLSDAQPTWVSTNTANSASDLS